MVVMVATLDQNGTVLAILNLHVAPMPSIKQITIEDVQDGCLFGHLGHSNKMILAILNFHVAHIPPTKLCLIPTYHSEADVV